jgi:hypothetical protein
MGFTGTKLVMTCVKRHWEWTYTPPAGSSSELTEGELLLGGGSRGLMSKNCAMWAFFYLGTNFLVA